MKSKPDSRFAVIRTATLRDPTVREIALSELSTEGEA